MARNTRWMSVYTQDTLTILLSHPFADLFASGHQRWTTKSTRARRVSAFNEVNTRVRGDRLECRLEGGKLILSRRSRDTTVKHPTCDALVSIIRWLSSFYFLLSSISISRKILSIVCSFVLMNSLEKLFYTNFCPTNYF